MKPLTSRRALLIASAGTLPVLAGCSGQTPADPATSTPGTPPSGTPLPEIPCADRGIGTRELLPRTEEEWYEGSLALSGDRSELVACTYYGLVVWSTADGKIRRKGPDAYMVDWNPKRDLLVIDSCAAQAQLISSTDFTPVGHLTGHDPMIDLPDLPSPLSDVRFAPGGEIVVTTGHDYTLRGWDVESRVQLWRLPWSSHGKIFTPDGRIVAREPKEFDPENASTTAWSVTTGERLAEVDGLDKDTYLSLSPDGTRLLATRRGRTLHLLDTTTFQVIESHELDHEVDYPGWVTNTHVATIAGDKKAELMLWELGSKDVRTVPLESEAHHWAARRGATSDTFYVTNDKLGIIEYDLDLNRVRVFEKP